MAKQAKELTQRHFEAIRDHLFDRIHKTGEQIKHDFPNILRRANDPLPRLKSFWNRASPKEKKEFLKWLNDQEK